MTHSLNRVQNFSRVGIQLCSCSDGKAALLCRLRGIIFFKCAFLLCCLNMLSLCWYRFKSAVFRQRPYSVTFGYVKTSFGIAVVRATNLCLRGARLKTHTFDDRRYLWDEEGLYRLHNQHF